MHQGAVGRSGPEDAGPHAKAQRRLELRGLAVDAGGNRAGRLDIEPRR